MPVSTEQLRPADREGTCLRSQGSLKLLFCQYQSHTVCETAALGQSSPQGAPGHQQRQVKVYGATSHSHGSGQVTPSIEYKVRDTVLILITAIPEGHLQGEPVWVAGEGAMAYSLRIQSPQPLSLHARWASACLALLQHTPC